MKTTPEQRLDEKCPVCGVEFDVYECSRTDEKKRVPHRKSQCIENLRTQLHHARAHMPPLCEKCGCGAECEDAHGWYEMYRETQTKLDEALAQLAAEK